MIDNDDIEYEGQDSPDTEYIIDPIDATRKSIIYGLYAQLNSLVNFYNRVQNSYKNVAITWVVAVLISIGYLFSQEMAELPFFRPYVIISICVFAICGITLLWFLDIFIYQTYFFGAVLECAKLEKRNEWLPKVNSNIAALQVKKKVILSQSWFYIGCDYIFIIIISLMTISLANDNVLSLLYIIPLFLMCSWLITFIMLKVEHPDKMTSIKENIHKIVSKRKIPTSVKKK